MELTAGEEDEPECSGGACSDEEESDSEEEDEDDDLPPCVPRPRRLTRPEKRGAAEKAVAVARLHAQPVLPGTIRAYFEPVGGRAAAMAAAVAAAPQPPQEEAAA